jgi:LacI family transcriptional regulator
MTCNSDRRATIYDVAKDAGVSVASVSRVLEGRANVSADMKKRVLESVHRLQYVPNKMARNLARQRTETIGLIITNIENPFFGSLAKTIDLLAQDTGYTLILSNTDGEPERELNVFSEMAKQQVAGIIWVPSLNQKNKPLATEMSNDIPLVTIDDQCEGCASVCVDHMNGIRQILNHLEQLGHRHIAYVGGPNPKERYFRDLLSKSMGIDDVSRYVFDHHHYTSWVDLCVDVLKAEPRYTAIWAHNDLAALRIYEAMEELSVSIPDEISIVGYDDTELAIALRPRLTSVAQSSAEIGWQAFQVLHRRIKQSSTDLAHISLQPQLIVRDSTRSIK